MPISFILLGIIFLFSIMYIKNNLLKYSIALICFVALLGYFFGTIYVSNYTINIIFILLPFLVGILGLLKVTTKKLNIISLALLSCLVYLIIAKINSDLISVLTPYPAIIVMGIIGLSQISKPINLVSYYCFSYLFITLSNIILEKPLGLIIIGELSLFNFTVILIVVSVLVSIFSQKIKFRKRKNV